MEPVLSTIVWQWANASGVEAQGLPAPEAIDRAFASGPPPWRTPVPRNQLAAWEDRHGYQLPHALRRWLLLSNGFYWESSSVHPLHAIGPMVAFARIPNLWIQPESWFELGDFPSGSVCLDLGYQWPSGDCPVFTSGDDRLGLPPRVIAPSFATWFIRLLAEGGREFWVDAEFRPLGDPWHEHRRQTAPPVLPDHLQSYLGPARSLIQLGRDEHAIAHELGVSRAEVEALLRHHQHFSEESYSYR